MRRLLASIVIFISGTFIWIDSENVPLPTPAQHHYIQPVPSSELPKDPAPLEGIYAPNELLHKAHRLFDGLVKASEHVAISLNGNMTLLDKFGYVFEAEPADHGPGAEASPGGWKLNPNPVAYVGPGRPLGFHHDKEGNLIIADAVKGLLKLHHGSRVLEVLSSRVSPDAAVDPGRPLTYVNALDIADDGTIYFTASQDIPVGLSREGEPYYDTFRSYLLGLYGGSRTGRLLKYDPVTRRTEVLVSGLWYTNGVALSADESYVTVVETSRFRVHRHWLKGPQAGTTEVLIEQLPGFPDGIARASDGNFWVALVAPPFIDPKKLASKRMRVLWAYVPQSRPKIGSWGAVLKISPAGKPLQLLMDPDGSKVAFVSAITEHGGRLYFGNVRLNYVSYIDMRDVPPLTQSDA